MSSRIASMQPPAKKSTRTAQTAADKHSSFGARLKQERERRKISIAAIADSTKILGALLEGLENDDVSRWPIGFYRRAFLRSYAQAIGLDPDATWREFAERFPEPEDSSVVPFAAAPRSSRARLRLTLADRVAWFVGGRLIERLPPRLAAVSFDLAVVGSVAIFCIVALGQFWLPLSLAAVCYYCGGVLILGNAPGVCLFAPPAGDRPPAAPSDRRESAPPPKPQHRRGTSQIQALDLLEQRTGN